MNLISNTPQQQQLFYNTSKWCDISGNHHLWFEFLANNNIDLFSPYLPLHIALLKNQNDLDKFNVILSLDGAYGLIHFFNRFRSPEINTKLLIRSTLRKFIPKSWASNIIIINDAPKVSDTVFSQVNLNNFYSETNSNVILDQLVLTSSFHRIKFLPTGIKAQSLINSLINNNKNILITHSPPATNVSYVKLDLPIYQSFDKLEIEYNKPNKVNETSIELFKDYYVELSSFNETDSFFESILKENKIFFKHLSYIENSIEAINQNPNSSFNFLNSDLESLSHNYLC